MPTSCQWRDRATCTKKYAPPRYADASVIEVIVIGIVHAQSRAVWVGKR